MPEVAPKVPFVPTNMPDITQDVPHAGLIKVPDVSLKVSNVPQEEGKSPNVSDIPKKVQFRLKKVPDAHQKVSVVPQYEQIRPIVAVGKNGYAPGELWNPWGVAIYENSNLIYVAEGFNSFRISIFSDSGEFINTFTHQGMKEPWGIAIHRDNLYVTDTRVHAIFQFKIKADMYLVAKLDSERSGMGSLYYPRGLTVSTNGDVFVADCKNNRIQILDDSLHFQREIIHKAMKQPNDVKLTPDEVYVLCGISPCIFVFSHAGEKIRHLITRGMGMQIEYAYFFCLDRNQNLLISDCSNHQIRIFTKEGTHLHNIGREGQEVGMLYSPQGIVLTENLNLIIVSKNDKYRVQILDCI